VNDLDDHSRSSAFPLSDRPYHQFVLVVCSNNVSLLHRFRGITTFTVHVTACDMNSLSFYRTVEVTSQVQFPIHVKLTRAMFRRSAKAAVKPFRNVFSCFFCRQSSSQLLPAMHASRHVYMPPCLICLDDVGVLIDHKHTANEGVRVSLVRPVQHLFSWLW